MNTNVIQEESRKCAFSTCYIDCSDDISTNSCITQTRLTSDGLVVILYITLGITSSSVMAERPRELGDFKEARVNGGTDNHSLKGFSQVLPLSLTDPHHYGNQIISSTRPSC